MTFSERQGMIKPKVGLQIDSIDQALRNCLWNSINRIYIEKFNRGSYNRSVLADFLKTLWNDYFKQPNDGIDEYNAETMNTAISQLRKGFLKTCEWYQVYDIIEFFANNFPAPLVNASFIKECNGIFEKELSGYRFVGKQICAISSKTEIEEIEQALQSPLKSVNIHLESALKLLADKQSPDYRNSIKESISAVEAICKLIAKNEKTTLGVALNKIEKEGNIKLHQSLKEAFSNLYGYTNDADGIRHALKDDKVNADFDEAKFMLVTCSAFVNYLISKTTKTGIEIESPNPNNDGETTK